MLTIKELKAKAAELGLEVLEGDKRLKATWQDAILWAESMVGMASETVEQVAQETLATAKETLETSVESVKTFWYSERTQDILGRLWATFVFLCALCVSGGMVARDLYEHSKGLQEYLSETFMMAKDDLRELRESAKTLMPPQAS